MESGRDPCPYRILDDAGGAFAMGEQISRFFFLTALSFLFFYKKSPLGFRRVYFHFDVGAIGGGIWHSVKGARNSPRGERLRGSITAVKSRSPVLGGILIHNTNTNITINANTAIRKTLRFYYYFYGSWFCDLGNFAVWGLLFSSFDCSFSAIRRKVIKMILHLFHLNSWKCLTGRPMELYFLWCCYRWSAGNSW